MLSIIWVHFELMFIKYPFLGQTWSVWLPKDNRFVWINCILMAAKNIPKTLQSSFFDLIRKNSSLFQLLPLKHTLLSFKYILFSLSVFGNISIYQDNIDPIIKVHEICLAGKTNLFYNIIWATVCEHNIYVWECFI